MRTRADLSFASTLVVLLPPARGQERQQLVGAWQGPIKEDRLDLEHLENIKIFSVGFPFSIKDKSDLGISL